MSYRVLSGQIKHETNTFSRLSTTLDSYRERYLCLGGDVAKAMRGTLTEMGAFLAAADRFGWSLVYPIAANATPSGRLTSETWYYLRDKLLTSLERDGPFDGILLSLHGAMVTETTEDAEGELLAMLRERVGPDMPICVTLDLHANVTERMANNASTLIAYRTYPHVDMYERGMQAAELLQRAMDGEIRPVCLTRHRPQIDGADHGRSQSGPMAELLRRAARYEQEPGILVVSIQAGFPWADIRDTGPSIAVTHDGAEARATEIAESMMDYVWETRHQRTIEVISTKEAMARCKGGASDGKPVVLADFSDNPGGGSYGDSPALLRAMVEAGVTNAAFGVITDPEVVQASIAAGVGGKINVALGGKFDTEVTPPFDVKATVVSLSDGAFTHEGPMTKGLKASMGPTTVLRIGSTDTIVTTHRLQVLDRQIFVSQGIQPTEKAFVAVKSAHHFRAAFEPIASEVILVDAAGINSPDLKRFPYKHVRRPVWPLDLD
jgi:microcystin degradation protein MlrC